MQAFFQPYEQMALNVLDSLGIFCLLCTQILSILFLYVDSSDTLVVDKEFLEHSVTVCLFALNILMLLGFACAYVMSVLKLDWRALRCRKRVTLRLVVDLAVVERALTERWPGNEDYEHGEDEEGRQLWWKHPTSGIVVRWPPLHGSTVDAGEATHHWLWLDADGNPECMSLTAPQLLQIVGADEKAPLPGSTVCLFDAKRKEVSPLLEIPEDMGGYSLLCKKQVPQRRFDWAENPARRFNDNDPFGDGDGGEGAVDGIRLGALAHAARVVNDDADGALFDQRNPDAHIHGAAERGVENEVAVAAGVADAAAVDDDEGSEAAVAEEGAIAASHGAVPVDRGVECDDTHAHVSGWFYEAVDDASVLHGPFSLAVLREWLIGGDIQSSNVVRHGRDGDDVALSTLLRMADDGLYYTRAEFVEFFGRADEWSAAGGDHCGPVRPDS